MSTLMSTLMRIINTDNIDADTDFIMFRGSLNNYTNTWLDKEPIEDTFTGGAHKEHLLN